MKGGVSAGVIRGSPLRSSGFTRDKCPHGTHDSFSALGGRAVSD